jgi:hypothetical protein
MSQSLRFAWFTHKEQRQIALCFANESLNRSRVLLAGWLSVFVRALRPTGGDMRNPYSAAIVPQHPAPWRVLLLFIARPPKP